MGFRNLLVGVSGLKAQQRKMDVVSNNLANLTTSGFKKNRVTFKDMFYDHIKGASQGDGANLGGSNPMDVGNGVAVASIDKVFTQGARTTTGRAFDFYVEGKDFMAVQAKGTGEIMFTRNGAFQLDGDLYLTDGMGSKVLGFQVDKESGEVADQASVIQLDAGPIDPNATTEVSIKHNIDSSSAERVVTDTTDAWEIFHGGESFGEMQVALSGGAGQRATYGSSYYRDSVIHVEEDMVLSSIHSNVLQVGSGTHSKPHMEALGTGGADFTIGNPTITTQGIDASYVVGDTVTVTQVLSDNSVVTEEHTINAIAGNDVTFDDNLGFSGANFEDGVTTAHLHIGLSEPETAESMTAVTARFSIGDEVSIFNSSTGQEYRTITAITDSYVTLNSAVSSIAGGATVSMTNLSSGTDNVGSSSNGDRADILRSQVSVVDRFGNMIANFYRVGSAPAEYTRQTATIEGGGSTLVAGTGEFTDILELAELIERALDDDELTHHSSSDDMNVSVDQYGAISFEGTGLVSTFRVALNAENTEMRDFFGSIAIDGDEISDTQALIVNTSGEVAATSVTEITSNRSDDATTNWFESFSDNFGYDSQNASSSYGEFAGLRLSGTGGMGYGKVAISMTNALGETAVQEFSMVSRDADKGMNEFSTMGELAQLVEDTLQTAEFSSLANGAELIADKTVSAEIVNGRLSVSTGDGVFNNLVINAQNDDTDPDMGITRTDQMNFGSVMGAFANGVNGKQGVSNQMIEADAVTQTLIFDSEGNEHTMKSYFVRDRSAGLTNIEYKYKIGLNPNLNTFSSSDADNNLAYRETYNTVQDVSSVDSQGIIGFDIETGEVLSETSALSSGRYRDTGGIWFTPTRNDSQEAAQMQVDVDFTGLTAYNGSNTILSTNLDGFGMGSLVRYTTEESTGNINGVYSNGKIRTLAKIGLVSVSNPGGLSTVGSSYFKQTVNSNEAGTQKNITNIHYVGSTDASGIDSITSMVSGGALEASNVDLTQELTEMIITQRAFSAAGKTITSSDEMLQETLNLKR